MSVLLSGEESEITFIDHAYIEMTVSSSMLFDYKCSLVMLNLFTARELFIVVRSARISRYLLICRPEFLFHCGARSASSLDEREYRTKGCYTCWKQS